MMSVPQHVAGISGGMTLVGLVPHNQLLPAVFCFNPFVMKAAEVIPVKVRMSGCLCSSPEMGES